jgi:hypothetical protein
MRHERSVRRGDDVPPMDRASETKGRAAVGSMHDVRRTLQRVAVTAAEARARQERALARIDDATGVRGATAARAEARAAVTAYVVRLRGEGLPPQRVLVALKAVARDASPPDLEMLDQRALIEDVVRWSIAAYYAA